MLREASHGIAHETEFAAGLLNPALAAPGDAIAPNGANIAQRYNVYRNNVTVSLIDALAAVYPATQRLTGTEFFRAMARFHVRATPPVSPLLFEYGRDFPAFIEAYEYARELPWLADVARIERAWLDAYHAEDQPPLAADALAQIDPAALPKLRFIAHASARIVRSRYSAVSIFAMHRSDDEPTPIDASEPEDALVTRIDDDVTVLRLPPGGAAFLRVLFEGECFGAAVAIALHDEPAFDLSANLAGMIEAGAFTAIQPGA